MTDIDTSKWPKPGETWKTRTGTEYGPLRLTKTGMLEDGSGVGWAPNGSWCVGGMAHPFDLVSKVEPKPEPVEFWVNEYENSPKSLRVMVECQSLFETLQEAAAGVASRIIRHHRVRAEVIETVEAWKP